MASGIKVRIVRCPRCRETLPEPPDHPLYRCGNCDTVIQAKSARTSRGQVSDFLKTSPRLSVSVEGEARSSLDKHEFGNANCEDTTVSEEILTSPDIAPSTSQHLSVGDDQLLKLKGKKKLMEGSDEDQVKGDEDFQGVSEPKSVLELTKDAASTSSPIVTPDSPVSDSHVSLYLTSPDPDFDASSFARKGLYATSPITDFSSDTDLIRKSISTYPASCSYYAYDGSESSYDGMDDHKLDKTSHPFQEDVDCMSSGEGFNLKKRANGRLPGDDPRKSWIPERFSGTRKDGLRSEKMRNISMPQFASGDAQSSLHVFNSSENVAGSNSDKLDLMRIVWELRDQLDKMKINSKFAVQGQNYSDHYEHHHLSRNAYSMESARCRNQLGCSCLQCYHPGNLNCSVQLPMNHKQNYHSDHSCHDTSHQHDTQKKEMKPKTVMKHILPVAGGAPFIACNYCWKLLQIPAELFISSRRYHKLMCGVCKKVMRFSLHNGTHLAPYTPLIAATPTGADDAGSQTNAQVTPRRSSSTVENDYHSKGTSGASSEGIDDKKKAPFTSNMEEEKVSRSRRKKNFT